MLTSVGASSHFWYTKWAEMTDHYTHHFQKPSISKNIVAFHSHLHISLAHSFTPHQHSKDGPFHWAHSRRQKQHVPMTSICHLLKCLRQQVNQISPFWGDTDHVTNAKKMGWTSTAVPKQQLICCGHWQVRKELMRLREISYLQQQICYSQRKL